MPDAMHTEARIAENYRYIRARIERACTRAGRPISDVTLVAVVKYARLNWIRTIVELGCRDLGESRPQQLEARASKFGDSVRWHLIGHLQRNKARRALPLVFMIHSVDNLPLLQRIDALASERKVRPRVLLEVNVSGESAKDGFAPHALLTDWHLAAACRNVDLAGLMSMAPLSDDPEASRPLFRSLRDLRDRLSEVSPPHVKLTDLSMGMSQDFEVAVEEGATFVRVGSDLFAGLES